MQHVLNPHMYTREICSMVLILLYGEKHKHHWSHWKTKIKNESETIMDDFKRYHRTPVQWQLDLCKPHVSASWFTYEMVRPVNKPCAAWLLWIQSFYTKGLEHIEEVKLEEAQEAAKKVSTKVVTATEFQQMQAAKTKDVKADMKEKILVIQPRKTISKKPKKQLNPSMFKTQSQRKEAQKK